MSDTTTNGRDSRGVQAYRWIVGFGIGAIGLLALSIQNGIADTGKAVRDLEVKLSAIGAKLEHISRQNDTQDAAIGELQRRVWRWPGGPP